MTNILVLPDAHSKPGVSNERFSWLGHLIVDLQPDVVVCIGDFADLPSLSSYDVGKKSFEGKRFIKDCESSRDALDKLKAPITNHNLSLRARKVKTYQPKWHMTLGNHENRINRVINNDPKLDGTIGVEDLGYEEFGFNVVPFLEPLIIDEVMFQHYYTSGNLDRAVSGANAAKAIMKRNHCSSFAGHSHLLDLAWEANSKGELMMSGTCGAYFEHREDYLSLQAQRHWARGVLYLKNVEKGIVKDHEFISLATIKQSYR